MRLRDAARAGRAGLKRFWSEVSVVEGGVMLDARPLRTPARAPLTVPSAALAAAIADEWRGVIGEIDPRAMPLTGLANAAIDRVAPDRGRFVATLASYAETDTLCYRAATPPALAARQAATWDPMLDWARPRYDIGFVIAQGIVHVAQPPGTIARLTAALDALDAMRLAAMAPLITTGGSLVAALVVEAGACDAATAFAACHLDELWQAELWGEEWSAKAARDARRDDFASAERFLRLLD